MKEFECSVPVMGIALVTVSAETEEEALSAALDVAGPDDVDEWDVLRVVVEGNVFHGRLNRARIDSIYDEDAT